MTFNSGSTSELPPAGTKIGGYRLQYPSGGQVVLKRHLLLTLLLGIGGLILLLLGVGLFAGMARQLFAPTSENRGENRSAMKMILFLVAFGCAGLATLLGTSALIFDSAAASVERHRLLGMLKTRRSKSDLKSVDVKIFTVPNGTLMCTFHVLTVNNEKFSPGVQYPLTDPGAAVLGRLTLWLSRHFAIPYRVLMDPSIPLDTIPNGEMKSLLV